MPILTGDVLIDLAGLLIAIFAGIYAYWYWISQTWKRKNVPYIQPMFIFGNRQPLLKGVNVTEDVFQTVKNAQKKGWKYFGLFLTLKPFFVPLDHDLIKVILTKDFNHFTDRGIYYNERDDPLSAHLFAIGGVKWRNLRTKLTPTFTSGKMRGMFQTLVNCGELLEEYLKHLDSTKPLDIKTTLAYFSTDIIGSCAFGIDCNSFKEPDSPFIKYGKKIFERDTIQQLKTLIAISLPSLSRALHIKLLPTDVSEFFFNVVRKTVNYREQNTVTRNDFLQLLIDIKNNKTDHQTLNTGDGTTLTMNEMVAQCFVFFLAGFETSSTTMTFALYELSINPEIQEKVRNELIKVLKKYDNQICYDSLKELEYMQQVLDETLRKYPPVPFVTRECVEDYKFSDIDLTLEKGTTVLIPIKNIHYDEEVYKNPNQFDPDRFNHENKHNRNQYAHIPFGEGPRMCIGMRFGLMQSKVGLATILRNFRVKLSARMKTPLEFNSKSFIPSTKGGMWLDLERL